MYGSVNVPGAAATVKRGGAMSAADKLSLETLKNLTLQTEMVRTRSGNPVIFPDGADANVKDLRVTLTPTQSGSGDPSPDNIRPISGAASVTVTRTGKNLVPMYLARASNAGISYSLNADGSLHCDGTVPEGGNSSFSGGNYDSYEACPWKLPAGTYTVTVRGLTDNSTDVSAVTLYSYRKSESTSRLIASNMLNGSKTFTIDEPFGAWFWLYVRSGKTVNQNVYIQIERGSVASDYEPYQGQSVTASLTDSNSDPLTVYGGTLDVTTGELTVTHYLFTLNSAAMQFLEYVPQQSVDGSAYFNIYDNTDHPSVRLGTVFCDALPAYSEYLWDSPEKTPGIITDGRATSVRIPLTSAQQTDSATAIAAFRAYMPETWSVCFRLATPITYQLTPAQLATLSGYNSVTTDAGTLSVTYRADPALAYAELESNLTNAILSLGAGI